MFMYRHLLNNKQLAIPHDNAVQNQIWVEPYLQQKIIQPLRHHMSEQEIISKFNQIFNAAAADVQKQYGENLYDLQQYENDMFHTDAGFTEDDYIEPVESPFGSSTEMTSSDVIPALCYDSYQGEMTAKEKRYLTEMCLVFNDDKSAITKTYNHFSKFGASPALTKLYNESMFDWLFSKNNDGLTQDEETFIKNMRAQGLSDKTAIGKAYYKFKRNSSPELKRLFNNYSEIEWAENEETCSDEWDDENEELFSAPPAYPSL